MMTEPVDNPNEGSIMAHLEECVMSEIYEYFSFGDEIV